MDLFTCMVALTSGGVSTNIPIPGDLFSVAKELATCFLDGGPLAVSTEIELIALFLAYCSPRKPDVAVAVFLHLHKDFCADENIHVVVQQLNLSTEQAHTVLKGYYSVWDTLEARQLVPNVPVPAIFSDANFKLAAMFGGQSGADNCLDEAAWLLDIYGPLLSDFVTHMSEFLKRESADPLLAKAHSHPLDIAGWLASPDTMPDAKYLVMAPVAIPVLGLIQAMHVVVLYKTLNMSPGDLVSRFNVAIGHSQGLPMAAAFASVTDEVSFYAVAEKTLGILLTMPAILYVDFSSNALHTGIIEPPLCSGELSTPMVSVRGLDKITLESFITAFNADRTDETSKVSLALVNGRSFFIVSGYPNAISLFGCYISKHTILPAVDQSCIRFPQRKPVAVVTPLSISEPYHCDLQLENASKVYEFVTAKGWVLNADALRIQVNGGDDGHDLRDEVNITRFLVDSMVVHCVNWPATVNNADAAYTVDFSPGKFSIFGKCARDILDGYGKAIISASALLSDTQSRMGSKADLFKRNISDVFSAPNWQSAFGPRLVQTAHEGQFHIRTRMSLTLGLPPVMVAGTIPTMSNEHFVAAISNAGYHVELAGSGIHTEAEFIERVENLTNLLEPGSGFAINMVYMNKKQWAFQYPSILRMRREGVPITGLCIGASVPSVDVANTIIAELRDAGIRHVAFKPGSVATILQTLAIARANPDFPVIIQWTGGRGGGCYSFEDFHEPILETYSKIRSLPNTILVVGSGFGDAGSILPYLSGQWSVQFGHAPMPVDGVLL
ncbi:fatty acid synthase alpha subunit Lsd1, partial [Linderina pennispora]